MLHSLNNFMNFIRSFENNEEMRNIAVDNPDFKDVIAPQVENFFSVFKGLTINETTMDCIAGLVVIAYYLGRKSGQPKP